MRAYWRVMHVNFASVKPLSEPMDVTCSSHVLKRESSTQQMNKWRKKLTHVLYINTSVISWLIKCDRNWQGDRERPCSALLNVCPWYYSLWYIMNGDKDKRMVFDTKQLGSTLSFLSSAIGSTCEEWMFDDVLEVLAAPRYRTSATWLCWQRWQTYPRAHLHHRSWWCQK